MTDDTGDLVLDDSALSPIEADAVDFFIRIAGVLRVSRSIGAIYGLLFASSSPVPADYIREKLRLSTGSTSQGLRVLRSVGAVSVTFVPGDRRDCYVAETGMQKIALGFFRVHLAPKLCDQDGWIERLGSMLDALPPSKRPLMEKRIEVLRTWRSKADQMLPLLLDKLDEGDARRSFT